MAISTVTITLTNTKQANAVVGEGYKPLVVISPTGITTPQTPYDEWVADSSTVLEGTIAVPAWKKLQYFVMQPGAQFALQTDNYDEVYYYETLKLDGLGIKFSPDPLTVIAVSLDKTTASLTVGGSTVSVTATTNPAGGTVTWASSDESVATVADGVITAVAAGTATITATSTIDGVTVSANCVATVTA